MNTTFSSPLPPRSFAARLKRDIYDSFRIKWYTVALAWNKPVAGEVWTWSDNTIRFFIFKRRFLLNSLAPQLEGTISSTETGSTIITKVSIRHIISDMIISPAVVILIILFNFYVRGDYDFLEKLFHQQWLYYLALFGIPLLIVDGVLELRYLERFISKYIADVSSHVLADH